MKLFKNKVGRPSNEEIKKRKIVYTSLISFIVLLVGVGAFFAGKYINKILGSANQRECVMPYTKAKCYNKTNDTVKKIQEMLKRLGYYNGSLNGTFDNNTYNAVKKFQKSQGIEQDGNVGPDTLKRLARKTNVKYYIIKFDKNGGSGTLDSSYKNELVVINGILTRLPSVKLTKKGYTHVGYFASTRISNGNFLRYGCFTPNCTGKLSEAYTDSERYGKTFYDYLYMSNSRVGETGWEPGQVVTFKAVYCSSGMYYDTTKSKCVKSSTAVQNYQKPNLTGVNVTKSSIVKAGASGALPLANKEQLKKIINNSSLTTGARKKVLSSLVDSFMYIQSEYKVNAVFALGVCIQESAGGTSKLAKNKNNLFGMKSGKNYAKYSSKSESVKAFGRLISGKTYFGKGRTSVSAIGKVYCDSNWSSYVVRNMNNLYKASK